MMKSFILVLTSIVLLVAVAITKVNPVRSEPDQFIIDNADAVEYVSTIESQELNSLIEGVGPHFVVEFANGITYFSM